MSEPQAGSAYELLTKPTLNLTDDEVSLVIADLRRRREAYVSAGKRDEPHKPSKTKPTAESKASLTAAIAANLDITF